MQLLSQEHEAVRWTQAAALWFVEPSTGGRLIAIRQRTGVVVDMPKGHEPMGRLQHVVQACSSFVSNFG